MLLPAIQAARESAPAAEGDECLVFLVGGVPKEVGTTEYGRGHL